MSPSASAYLCKEKSQLTILFAMNYPIFVEIWEARWVCILGSDWYRECVFFLVREWHHQKQRSVGVALHLNSRPCQPPRPPTPGDSEGSLVWHETAQTVTSECLDPSWLGGQGQGLLYASLWQTPTSALCSYQLTSLAQKVSSQGERKKSNPVSSSHKSLVSSRESNCTEADFFFFFFISNKRFYALVNLVDVICT